jgi:serine phosphatase RsbU (regulator of sigma subunit)
MNSWRDWWRRRDVWRSMPIASYATFIGGVFLMFSTVGLLGDMSSLGSDSPSRLAVEMLFSGGLAVAYLVAFRRPRWLLAVAAIHIFLQMQSGRLFPAPAPPLAGEALHKRLQTDGQLIVLALAAALITLSTFARREGTRYVRAHTEIALARDIHRLLVPPIARRVGAFEFRGISTPSGEVGGDLIDLVESEGRWFGYVADVSGHGVGAGLLMGMVKSAARTQLRTPRPLDECLDTLNAVLVDLKKPEMYVTFAAMQFDGTSELQFSLAGHLPIIHYRSAASTLDELSLPQVPLAMFADRSFSASRVAYAPGDLFVILTDGLTEVFDRQDQEFGLERVKALVHEHAAGTLECLEAALLTAVRRHGQQFDDQTLLLIRVIN